MAKRVTPEEIVEMRRLYNKYGNYAEVGRQIGRSSSTVRKSIQPIEHQDEKNANMSEKANTNEKGKETAPAIIFGVLLGIAFLITEKMITSVLLAAVLTGVICAFMSSINNKSSKDKKENYKKIVIWSIVLLSVLTIFLAFIMNNKPQKCVNCGQNGMYTKSGWCYSCYKDAKKAVGDSYNKY